MVNETSQNRIFVTGGAGFIGSQFVRNKIFSGAHVLVLDKLTYAGSLQALDAVNVSPNFRFVRGSINDHTLVRDLLNQFKPAAVVNFAAESHVDRSIQEALPFVETNVLGTTQLLAECLRYWEVLSEEESDCFRFLQVSTDEVFGSLESEGLFSEISPYAPNSPYAASKAAADHFVRASYQTYGFPTLTSYSSNNFGPFQNPEKMIPKMIVNALRQQELPVYGDGSNVREWLSVQDHCEALSRILQVGKAGETYAIGGGREIRNIDLVHMICRLVDDLQQKDPRPAKELIQFVADRPGHDFRYALNGQKLERELGWRAQYNFESKLEETVQWYAKNLGWVNSKEGPAP
ncbi:MAG: dTDP-glucose 4,6-dehydratase [Planctomycetota bacterium]